MRRRSGRTGAGSTYRHRPRADARARTRTGDERFLPQALQCADRLDNHRDRNRRAERQHHHHRARRQVRSGPVAPVARSCRAQSPPGLCLPADPATQTDYPRRRKASGSDCQYSGPWRGLRARHQRPGDPWRRRTARGRPERPDPGGGLYPVHGNARARGEVDSQGRTAQSRSATGRRTGNQPARAGLDPRSLPAGCAHAPDSLQAHCQRRRRRGPQGPAGRNDRPLRPAAGTDQESGAYHAAQTARRTAGHPENRRWPARWPYRVRGRDAG